MQSFNTKTLDGLTDALEIEAKRIEKSEAIEQSVKAQEEDGYDGFSDTKLKLIPSPNFTECEAVGTFLPVNMADETVTNLSKLSQQFDFVDFIKEQLGYSSRVKVCMSFASEQIDALVLAIKSFEKNNAFILGDMAGIGKGRVCAGVLRFAYQKGYIPVFFTHKPYLFSDIYRDIMDIGGFGYDKKGKEIEPAPFILHQDGTIKKKTIDPITGEKAIAAAPLKNKQTLEVCKDVTARAEKGTIEIPKEYNCVFLPYSTMSMARTTIKQNFLEAIAPRSIIVMDESHNAASSKADSNVLKRALPIVEASHSVLFSSATYAKTPQVFSLYVVKTALRTAVPNLESITDALKVGGENVSEYMASGLVKEGQMIRRERSFGNCKKVTDYVGSSRTEDIEGKAIYTPLLDDVQKQFYDEAIGYFKELRDFSKSQLASSAIYNSILRKCEQLRKEVVSEEAFKQAKNSDVDATQQEFIRRYRNKWVVSYRPDSITRYKQTFRENLFLAVKAKFSADKIIECLTTQVEYTNVDGTTHFAPMKPVVAIRNTGEAIFNELKLKEGDELNNDFSEYIKAICLKLFSGDFTLRKVDANIFESKSSLTDRGIAYEEIEAEYNVEMQDYADGGALVQSIQTRLNNYNSQLPFSVIDYLRDAIESTPRPNYYYNNKVDAKWGQASSANFKMAEGTSRNYMLVRRGDKWVFTKNDRIKSTTDVFQAFNNGAVDVMLINVVASTGGSAQSSPKEGMDTRPRNMFIIQFELDINIEVQKRGRVNRTGQVNSPTYTYIITKIPVELRTYLMFRKKLRKLDANTSADQTASSQTSEITDDKGNPIEDIFNAYGFDVFKNDFIELPQNLDYNLIFDAMSSFRASPNLADAEQVEYNIEQFNAFVRELELYPADFQEYFFNEMNSKYIEKVNLLKATNEYQLELEAKNYKASLKQRTVIQLNSGTTVFSLPLYLSDYYTLDDKRVWSKDRVEQKANELAGGKPLGEYHIELIEDYINEFEKGKQSLLDAFKATEPQRDLFTSDDEFETNQIRFQGRLAMLAQGQNGERNEMVDLLRYFKPMKAVVYRGNVGVFVGYNIKNTGSKFKYSAGSIDFVFCFLSKYPVLHLKKSGDYDLLKEIMAGTNLNEASFNAMMQGSPEKNLEGYGGGNFQPNFKRRVTEWKPDLNKRTVKRFLSGNILSGIVEANRRRRLPDSPITSWALTRFTNIDGSTATAVELKFNADLPDTFTQLVQDLAVSSDNLELLTYLGELPVSNFAAQEAKNAAIEFFVFPIWNVESDKVIDRAIDITKTQIPIAAIYYDIINVEILQPYIVDSKTKAIKELPETSERYNKIYYDSDFINRYSRFIDRSEPKKKTIKYAKRVWRESGVERSKYNDYRVNVIKLQFDLATDSAELTAFMSELYRRYEASFNFRSSNADYLNVASQADIFDPVKVQEAKKAFDEGEYQYRFIRRVSNELIGSIPNFKQKTPEGLYGGVILSLPLAPTTLVSYDLKPYKLPSDVLVKMAFSVLNDTDKAIFAQTLEDMAENTTAYDMGQFVQTFLSQRSVGTQYFFGDLRMSEYGTIFKEYALKNDVKSIVFEETFEETSSTKKVASKNKVTFDDAERFLMIMNP